MSVSNIERRYAKSLMELAIEQNILDKVFDDVSYFSEVVKVKDFELLLKSPIIKPDKKGQIFNTLFDGKIDGLTKSFLGLMLKKGREPLLGGVAEAFLAQYKEMKKISDVTLTTAAPLSDTRLAEIKAKLIASDQTHNKIDLKVEVNEDLIGGFILQIEDKIYDASVANRLNKIRKEFS